MPKKSVKISRNIHRTKTLRSNSTPSFISSPHICSGVDCMACIRQGILGKPLLENIPAVENILPIELKVIPNQDEFERINPRKLDNSHCRKFSNSNTPYTYNEYVSLDDPKKEQWSESNKTKLLIDKPNLHLGQRKLMLSEIQVLLLHYKRNPTVDPVVLYVGAATGVHLVTLSKMFPRVKFILYDGATIYPPLKRNKMFEVHDNTTPISKEDMDDPDMVNDGFFTIQRCKRVALTLNPDTLIFISDIRLFPSGSILESDILRDLRLQEKWAMMLKPSISLLKFRFPWMSDIKTFKYLRGDILYGIWSPPLSTETRLVVYQKDIIEENTINYKVSDYDDILFYHNKYVRSCCQCWIPKKFSPYINIPNNLYCSCYDCIAELNILNTYTEYANQPLNKTVRIFGMGMEMIPRVLFKTMRSNYL